MIERTSWRCPHRDVPFRIRSWNRAGELYFAFEWRSEADACTLCEEVFWRAAQRAAKRKGIIAVVDPPRARKN